VSYKSIKRVLGETSLERKCRFLFGGCLFVLITSSFWYYGYNTEHLVTERTKNTSRILITPILTRLHWKAYMREENPDNPNADLFAAGFAQKMESKEYTWEVINPRKQNNLSSMDREALELLKSKGPSVTESEPTGTPGLSFRNENDDKIKDYHVGDDYIYYEPIWENWKKDECNSCHARHFHDPNQALGNLAAAFPNLGSGNTPTADANREPELIAVIKVTLPDKETQLAINWNRAILLATAIITFILAMIAAYLIVRYVIVKPLKHLRDVSEEVAQGDYGKRAEINTADEFEELAKAFNKMLRNLVESQEDLKQVNNKLDFKVDELAQLNMRLYEMNRLKSDFLATMSHELRTPLNSIIGFSDVLSSIKSLDDKQQRYVSNIQKSGRVLLDMINDILDLAKIESGKMELKLSEFEIENVVSAQCDMAKPLAEKKNIDLEYDIASDLPKLFQDMGKVQQILNNLLSNAIKFTPEGGRITVRARRDEASGDLMMSVIDTGVGIALDEQTAIFEKFRQGGQVLTRGDAITREYSGTGLGLSIVKELCKLLGGEIHLTSELGQGSNFTVQLPVQRSDAPRIELPATITLGSSGLKATA
jgi:signal transduction histidine kinase